MKVFVLIRKNIISIVFLIFVICLVIFSNSNLTATANGLKLWANNVVPSLFPFFVAVELLSQTNIVYYLSKLLDKIMRPLFSVPGCGAFPFIMGLISGYPVGAKIVSNLYLNKSITKNEAERLLCFTNNSGPLFILGTVGISFYANSTIGAILLLTHILASITVGMILGIFARKKENKNYLNSNSNSLNKKNDLRISELGEVLGNSILNSIKTILMIGGFVVIFSVIISILQKTKILVFIAGIVSDSLGFNKDLVLGFLTGIIEFTNGLSIISSIHIKEISINIILSSFILGFGGISITLQVLSIISKSKLSIKKYILGKFLHGLIAALYTFLILLLPMFNFNL